MAAKTERLELDDGDFLDLAHAAAKGPRRATVCLFHGLAGCMESPYIRGAMHTLTALGFGVTLMHWRGCSGEPNRLARSYHSGATGDIQRIGALMQSRYPQTPVVAVGASLGANALLVHLGQAGEHSPFAAAVAVCPPLVLAIASKKLSTGFTRIYQGHLLSRMRAQHEAKRQAYPALDLLPAGPDINTFWAFDDKLTAPLHDFDGADHYYEACSARQWLGSIRRPTHILAARDDPFFTPDVLPTPDELADGTTLKISRHGGHMGFVGARGAGAAPGAEPHSRRWLDAYVARRVIELLA